GGLFIPGLPQRGRSQRVICFFVHHGRVQGADAFFRARIRVFGGKRVVPLFLGEVVGCCFKNIMDGDLGLVVQFHEGAICATVCRDGVICHPVTVHVPIQIFSRFRGCGCHVSPSTMCRVHWGLSALTTYCR